MDPKFEPELEALCEKYGYELPSDDGVEYLINTAPQPVHVPPPPTPDPPELVAAVAKSAETWMQRDRRRGIAIDPGEKSHGMVLTADTYVPANPETGDRARIVATIAPESAYSPKSGFRDPTGPFFTTPAARDAFAVRVLDAWALKTRNNVPQVQRDARGESWTLFARVKRGGDREWFTAKTPAEARFAAAQALVAEDPSLASEVGT